MYHPEFRPWREWRKYGCMNSLGCRDVGSSFAYWLYRIGGVLREAGVAITSCTTRSSNTVACGICPVGEITELCGSACIYMSRMECGTCARTYEWMFAVCWGICFALGLAFIDKRCTMGGDVGIVRDEKGRFVLVHCLAAWLSIGDLDRGGFYY